MNFTPMMPKIPISLCSTFRLTNGLWCFQCN